MKRTFAAPERLRSKERLRNGVFLVILFTFFAWTLRVALLIFDTLSDLTLAGILNEGLRIVVFVGPVLIYLRYVEKAPVLAFLKINRPRADSVWVLPLTGALIASWYPLLDNVLGNGTIAGAAPAVVLFTILSPATLVEEVYFRGFLLNKFWQATSFWRANFASSLLFVLVHFPGWYALGNFSTPLVVADALGLLVFGLVFGWVMKQTDSLWSAYLLHALNNLLVVTAFGT